MPEQKIAPNPLPISEAITDYLLTVELIRARKTALTYKTGMNQFLEFLRNSDYKPETDSISTLTEQTAGMFAQSLLDQRFSSATVKLYLIAVSGFYEYLSLELHLPLNLDLVRRILKSKSPRIRRRLPQFSWEDIEQVVTFCLDDGAFSSSNSTGHLINLRDRAFILTLADTGLRVHEACGLQRGDIDWNRSTALITGKGNKQALVRFSTRSMQAIKRYLSARSAMDGASGRPLSSLPVFCRHDKAAGSRLLPVSTVSGEKIVSRLSELALQDEEKSRKITPHSFRHYFVTRVVTATNNIKVAQELARHENISTTEIYTHLVDQDLDAFYRQAIEEDQP
jgi:site-specific recombinase XerD